MNSDHRIRREVWFSGRVQGVGFRYTVSRIGREFEVSGKVQNRPDGKVFLVAEGTGAEVDAFVEEICSEMEGYIRQVEQSELLPAEGEKGFRIAPD